MALPPAQAGLLTAYMGLLDLDIAAQQVRPEMTIARRSLCSHVHAAIWSPIGYDGCRMRLAELAGVPDPPESYRRIEETAEHRWRVDEQRRRDYPDRYGEA